MAFLETVESLAFLGPRGSYSEMAKDVFCEKYNLNVYQQPMKTIKSVLEYVDETPNTIGIVPVENSIEGDVREAVDNLIRTKNENIKILSEYVLPIRHCLLSRTTEISSISGVMSISQALAQCQNFIHNELPRNLDIIETASTSEAAKKLEEYNLTYAAIGSEKTAEIYNLNILKCNINDDPDNQTRFAMIGNFETPKTGNDVTTLAFSTENKPGALLNILSIFQDYQINLLYIASRPSKIRFGEYTFFVDFDGHITDEHIFKLTEEIKKHTQYYRLVGSYERMN